MSGRLLSARLAPVARRAASASAYAAPRRFTHYLSSNAGGLLRSQSGLRSTRLRTWPPGAYALHNVPAVRSISFIRILPRLFQKFATLGAVGGATIVGGLVYLQNQAQSTCF